MLTQKFLLRLKNASAVTVLSGAGISAASGVPTFRGKDGLWENHNVEDIATPQALKNNPDLFWKFYRWRKNLIKEVKPNLGHYALVDFERIYDDFQLVTQNVDNLHREAGNKKIVELHGNLFRIKCENCNQIYTDPISENSQIPICKSCNGSLRPDIVLFGENLEEKNLRAAQEAAAGCEIFFSIGTSALVEPAASLPFLAKGNGSYVVEINPEETPLSQHADECLRGKTEKLLPALIIIIEKLKS
jgi:NAD-dependent deacetylase